MTKTTLKKVPNNQAVTDDTPITREPNNDEYFVIAALYQFRTVDDPQALQQLLLSTLLENGVKGTLLVAHEGINGTIAGTRQGIDCVKSVLEKEGFDAMTYKESFGRALPFYRTKVKLKKEIVTMGVPGVDPVSQAGTYVPPHSWNALISDPEVLLIDTRNDYEYIVGTFSGAENPNTENFREFPDYVKSRLDPDKHKKVAMFCTGGIRCEKATAYVKSLGVENVYHLQGGILQYLEEVPSEESLWEGECFVFDNRVTVNHDMSPGEYDMCHGCRRPITEADKQSADYQRGVCCPYCAEELTNDQKQRFRERQKQLDLARERGEQHIGVNPRSAVVDDVIDGVFKKDVVTGDVE